MEDIEETEYVASEHDRLVSAISKLDKTQHITEPTRNEPTNLNTEFNLIKRANKLDLSNVVKVLGETASHLEIGKKLKKTQDKSRVLAKPLEKPQAERIKRSTGYEETKKKVGRWDAVVARSRAVDLVSFPLKPQVKRSKEAPTKEFISKFKLKSPLEKELEEIDPPVVLEEDEEEEQVYPMSYEEMVEHRQHLAKIRAQQSYNAAKAKRQSKIKSKKYHRILKKERLKQQLKEFEELQQKDPEEALKKLEALEKSRALERHTLRHKNTGKWAKNKLVRAKYDKEVRQQLAEQLAVSRGLTQKIQNNDSTDDEPDTNENIPDVTLAQDPLNPWMLKQSDKSNVDAEFDFGYKKYIQGRMFKRKDDSDDEDIDKDQKKIKGNDNDIKQSEGDLDLIKKHNKKLIEIQNDTTNNSDDADITVKDAEEVKKINVDKENLSKKVKKRKITTKPKLMKKKTKLVATSNWTVEPIARNEETKPAEEILSAFDNLQNNIANQVEKKLKKIRENLEKFERESKQSGKDQDDKKEKKEEIDNLEYLKMKNLKVRPIIDEELIETGSKDAPPISESKNNSTASATKLLTTARTTLQENADTNIDPSRFIEVKPKYLNTTLPDAENEFDQLDDEEQVVPKVNIEEVFEEDDVVASFRQEKEDEINKDKPQDIDLSLPGWGTWGGKGVKAPRRKRNRFIMKAASNVPRRDENKGDIIIKEYKDPKLASHKVTDVPFPFASVKDYEASIRAPIGNTFVPETAHKKLIRPSVVTKAGTIIEPMDEEELLIPKNRRFNNESVIKLLGKQSNK